MEDFIWRYRKKENPGRLYVVRRSLKVQRPLSSKTSFKTFMPLKTRNEKREGDITSEKWVVVKNLAIQMPLWGCFGSAACHTLRRKETIGPRRSLEHLRGASDYCYGYSCTIVFPSVFSCLFLSPVSPVIPSVSVCGMGVAYLSWLPAGPLQSAIIRLTCSACTPAPHLLISVTVYLLQFCIHSSPDRCFSPSGTHLLLATLCLLMLRVIPHAHDTLYLPVVSLCLQYHSSFIPLPARLPFTPRLSPFGSPKYKLIVTITCYNFVELLVINVTDVCLFIFFALNIPVHLFTYVLWWWSLCMWRSSSSVLSWQPLLLMLTLNFYLFQTNHCRCCQMWNSL